MFITFEGLDGSGKTTAMMYIKSWLLELNFDVLTTREPGGTQVGDEIRASILKKRSKKETLDPWTETLLFIADRKQHLVEVIEPALKQNKIVISDRFMDSTSAYQGAGRGIGVRIVDHVQHVTLGSTVPDLTIYFDVKKNISYKRMSSRKLLEEFLEEDRLEEEKNKYRKRVEQGYWELIQMHPERFKVIDANRPIDEVVYQIQKIIWESISKNDKRRNHKNY